MGDYCGTKGIFSTISAFFVRLFEAFAVSFFQSRHPMQQTATVGTQPHAPSTARPPHSGVQDKAPFSRKPPSFRASQWGTNFASFRGGTAFFPGGIELARPRRNPKLQGRRGKQPLQSPFSPWVFDSVLFPLLRPGPVWGLGLRVGGYC